MLQVGVWERVGVLSQRRDFAPFVCDLEWVQAKNIMLATGSDVVSLPGIELDEELRQADHRP